MPTLEANANCSSLLASNRRTTGPFGIFADFDGFAKFVNRDFKLPARVEGPFLVTYSGGQYAAVGNSDFMATVPPDERVVITANDMRFTVCRS